MRLVDYPRHTQHTFILKNRKGTADVNRYPSATRRSQKLREQAVRVRRLRPSLEALDSVVRV